MTPRQKPALLVIEALATAGEYLLDSARRLGLRVFVATHADVFAAYPPALRARIDGVVFTDFGDPDAAVRELGEFCRAAGVGAVVACWEFTSPLAAALAAELGLPGNDPTRAHGCRNKLRMAELFHRHGVPAPRTVPTERDGDPVRTAEAAGIGYPLVVKPAEEAGSMGVSVVAGPDRLPAAVRLARSWPVEFSHGFPLDDTALLQEYADGAEFSVETVVWSGRAQHVAITAKFTTGDGSRAELGHTVPAALDPADARLLCSAVDAALEALGVTDGPAHTEVKLTGDGAARVIEVAARPPGGHIVRLVRLARGVDLTAAQIKVAFGSEPDLEPRADGAAAIRFVTSPHAGVLTAVHGLPRTGDVVGAARVTDVAMYTEPGAAVTGPRDNLGRLGHVILEAASAREADAAAAVAMAGVVVDVDPAGADDTAEATAGRTTQSGTTKTRTMTVTTDSE
ncbi:ATP-grasp domain-containing protein [Streptomyces sp. PTM05]|uniref:ATP-grasp domain-containing protein n=1 Tax=Streptantibioticus parmotrematis TaxID=2873249 RepID=A0ABS7QS49_9ACTN|nr:ATP-grasp domain-containing protein [Streptantibioticus parmotrematis]MBY8886014.1 ATP-grasp domain-containing protein [Streptantibioticus parmotrematis]